MDLGDREGMLDGLLNALRTTGKAPRSLEMPSAVTPARGNSSTLNSTISFFFLTMTGNDLVVKPSGLLGRLGLLLGGGAEGIQLLAGDAPHVADVLRSGAHVVVCCRRPTGRP